MSKSLLNDLFKIINTDTKTEEYKETLVNSKKNDKVVVNDFQTTNIHGKIVKKRTETIIYSDNKEMYRSSLTEDIENNKLDYNSKNRIDDSKIIEYSNTEIAETKSETIIEDDIKTVNTINIIKGINGEDDRVIRITTVTTPNYYEKITDGIYITRKIFDGQHRIITIVDNYNDIENVKKFFYHTDNDSEAYKIITTSNTGDDTLENITKRIDKDFKYKFRNIYHSNTDVTTEHLTLSLYTNKSKYFDITKGDNNIFFYDRSIDLVLCLDFRAITSPNNLYFDIKKGNDELIVKMKDFNMEYKYTTNLDKEDYSCTYGVIEFDTEVGETTIMKDILELLYPDFNNMILKVKDIIKQFFDTAKED